jgi:hypothetical protein
MIELFLVFLGIARQRLRGVSTPDQLLGLTVEDVDHQRAHRDVFYCRSCKSIATKSAPEPPASQAVVERLQLLLVLC